jgi:hypothetical protein
VTTPLSKRRENKCYTDDRKCPASETEGSMEHTIRGCAKSVEESEDYQAPLQCRQDALMPDDVLKFRVMVMRFTRGVIYLPPAGVASARAVVVGLLFNGTRLPFESINCFISVLSSVVQVTWLW